MKPPSTFGMATAAILFCGPITAEVRFNREVRPILSDRCYACHGPDPGKRKTKLRFDQEPSAKAVIVAGEPNKSELFRRITSTDANRMPPAYAGHSKLSDREIETIRQWIVEGAHFEPHWSFAPPVRAKGATIDSLVRAQLLKEGMGPAAEADRATLVRRVALDLTGLPPRPEEPGTYEQIVDRLLASPAYAERMAIRWLEGARYSDTNGYQSDGPREMWRWRDWVIDAFARNMPYDQFTIEQIAGDLLPNATRDQKIATAFHRNHRTSAEGGIVDEEFRSEYVADRAETTATVWLGLTVGCARCHDHKYDPISQRDYYSLYAFFNNMNEKGLVYNFGNEEPYLKAPTPQMEAKLAELDRKSADRQREWDGMSKRVARELQDWTKRAATGPQLDWTPKDGISLDRADNEHFDGKRQVELEAKYGKFEYLEPFSAEAWIRPESPNGAVLSRGEDYLEGQGYYLLLVNGKLRFTATLRYTDISLRIETEQPIALNEWQHVAVTYNGRRKASGFHLYVNGEERKMKVLFDEFTYPFASNVPFRIGGGAGFRFTGDIRGVRAYNSELTPAQVSTLPVEISVDDLARKSRRTPAENFKLRLCFLEQFASGDIKKSQASLNAALTERQKFYDSIPTVMVMQEGPVRQAHVLKRGAYDAPGDPVTAAVPGFLPGFKSEWPANRLGLARWLVDPRNPLTARVTVNRYWQMLFGIGLVKTTEDFGSQGEWPLQQELLDWLAVEFIESGWDVKHILKTIVMSQTYRHSSRVSPELLTKDPENRLLARGPRVRLPVEMIRDQALAVSGLLIEQTGGPSVKPYQPPKLWQELSGGGGYTADHGEGLYRRSLYTYWKRTVPPPYMVNFDSPTRETCTVRESRTNTPLQALNLMNDTIFIEASRKLAERMLHEGGADADSRIAYGYRVVLARNPSSRELDVVRKALSTFQARFTADPKAAADLLAIGESKLDAGIDASKLAAYAVVANMIMNLDEAVTKQ